MDLSKILSISGKGGLFKVVSQSKNAVIVESLVDKKRFPAFGHERMSSLEEISIFTTGDDRPLKEVMKAFFDKLEGKAALDPKSADKDLVQKFGEIVPDYDTDRVYVSDIRKVFAWYNLLLSNDLLDFSEETSEEKKEEIVEEGTTEEPVAETPKKKAAPKAKNTGE